MELAREMEGRNKVKKKRVSQIIETPPGDYFKRFILSLIHNSQTRTTLSGYRFNAFE